MGYINILIIINNYRWQWILNFCSFPMRVLNSFPTRDNFLQVLRSFGNFLEDSTYIYFFEINFFGVPRKIKK